MGVGLTTFHPKNYLLRNVTKGLGLGRIQDLDVGGENNIKMNRREIGWAGMEWIHLAQDRDQWKALVNTVINPWGSITCW
jgi:hypothetical protein